MGFKNGPPEIQGDELKCRNTSAVLVRRTSRGKVAAIELNRRRLSKVTEKNIGRFNLHECTEED